MSFPSSIDSLTNPTATNTLNSPSHSGIETAQNTAITALETKVGVDSSAVTTSIDYLLKNTASVDPGHKTSVASLSPSANGFFNGLLPTQTGNAGSFLQTDGAGNTSWVAISNKFGGNGSDGALSVTSGTTTINCGNAAVVVKNYSSISITGTGVLAFSNPNTNGTIVILKSTGNVTLTSSSTPMIDLRNMGSAGSAAGSNGVSSIGQLVTSAGGATGTGGGAGVGGTVAIAPVDNNTNLFYYPLITVGAGGGGCNTGGGTGAGGNGGGSLIIECNGAWNFTTANGISTAGTIGTAGGNGIGGSGGSGSIIVRYVTLTSNSGTVNVGSTAGQTVGGGSFAAGGGGAGAAAGGAGSTSSVGGAGGAGVASIGSV